MCVWNCQTAWSGSEDNIGRRSSNPLDLHVDQSGDIHTSPGPVHPSAPTQDNTHLFNKNQKEEEAEEDEGVGLFMFFFLFFS